MSYIVYPVVFNGVDLNTINGLTVLGADPNKPPKRSLILDEIANTNKAKASSGFYTDRRITVRVGVSRNSRALLGQSLDALNNVIQELEKPLILEQSGSSRQYTCSLDDVNVLVSGGSYQEEELIFRCSDRFGYDLSPTLLLAITGYTSMSRSDRLSFGGSALWQAPVITLTLTSVVGGTAKTVHIGNADNGQEVAITRSWVSGDVIIIDSLNGSVKVNGVEVEFVGAIPEWKTGFGYWYYTDNFTSRTFSGSIYHLRRYV